MCRCGGIGNVGEARGTSANDGMEYRYSHFHIYVYADRHIGRLTQKRELGLGPAFYLISDTAPGRIAGGGEPWLQRHQSKHRVTPVKATTTASMLQSVQPQSLIAGRHGFLPHNPGWERRSQNDRGQGVQHKVSLFERIGGEPNIGARPKPHRAAPRSVGCEKARRLLRIIAPPVIQFRGGRIAMPGRLLHVFQLRAVFQRRGDEGRPH
jgi:hypothetical protein